MKTIGIDIGTTTVCAVIIDADTGIIINSITKKNDATIKTNDKLKRIQDPEIIVNLCETLVDELICRYGDIYAIGITSAMHGVLYVDENGNAISPLYTWQDTRANQIMRSSEMTYVEHMKEITGEDLFVGYGLVTHYYNMLNGLVKDEAKCICTIGDYVAQSLTKEKRIVMHQSMAASLGFFDIKQCSFKTEKLNALQIDPKILPNVVPTNEVLGYTQDGIAVSVAIGDNQASFLGSMDDNSNVLVNVGTGSQISVYSDQYLCIDGLETRPFIEDTVLLVGSALCGGYSYALFKNFIDSVIAASGNSDIEFSYEMINNEARKHLYDDKPVIIDTRFKGSRLDPSCKGSISEIDEDNFNVGSFALGILEGMIEELYQFYKKLPAELKNKETIVGSGNGIRKNDVLQVVISNRFNKQLLIPKFNEEAAIGAALFGLLAIDKQMKLQDIQKKICFN